MINKWTSFGSDFFIFLLIFSFYNDSFVFKYFGSNATKIPILVFLVFYFPVFLRNYVTLNLLQFRLVLGFLLYLFSLLLIEMILGWKVEFAPAGSAIIAIAAMVLYFGRYPLKKLFYFIWISMMASVIMCHFNQPIDEWTFRTTGGTEDPNEFATQLLAFFFISIYLFLKNHSKVFLFSSILFFTYGLFKAGSKSAFLILGVVGSLLILYTIISNPRLFFNYKALVGLLLAVGVTLYINPTEISGVKNMLERSKDSGTAAFRMHSWIAGFHMIEQHPLFGVGGDAFGVNEPLYEEFHMVGSAPAPHNVYIKLAAESGIPAFLFFIVILTHIVLYYNFKMVMNTDEKYIMAMLFSTLLMGLTLGFLYDKYFWLHIIILMNLNYQLKSQGYLR